MSAPSRATTGILDLATVRRLTYEELDCALSRGVRFARIRAALPQPVRKGFAFP
jgi:hypothetical protein